MNDMKIKSLGQVFTPTYIVDFMLNQVDYKDNKLIGKKILEPSAGDGQFVIEIIRRSMEVSKKNNFNSQQILKQLSNVFAIELDKHHHSTLKKNIFNEIRKHFDNKKISDEKIKNYIEKNIICGDSLKYDWKIKFDVIIGNPPYIRIHNLEKDYLKFLRENFYTMKNGNVDIYYAFYEKSFNELSADGKLILITPNAFLLNSSGKPLRNFIRNHIKYVYNFESFEIFKGISTYNAIVLIERKENEKAIGYLPIELNEQVVKGKELMQTNDKDKIAFSSLGDKLDKISINTDLAFKNGLATLSDDIFIHNKSKVINGLYTLEDGSKIEKKLTKNIVKISTFNESSKEKFIIFPYEISGDKVTVIEEGKLKKEFPFAYEYFLKNKDRLLKRSLDKHATWYSFGRSQALTSVLDDKIALRSLVKDKLIHFFVPKGTLVYSGLYSKVSNYDLESKIINDKKIIEYIKAYGQDKRGGYKTVNSSIFKEILNNG